MLKPGPGHVLTTAELVALVALLGALNALSIDIMLPALPDIGAAYGLSNNNDRQLVVIFYLMTFGLSQFVYGPLADAFGRRTVLIWSLGIYAIGTLLCVIAPDFSLLLAARAIAGVGAGATRLVGIAVVRDQTSGPRMAQILSMSMSVFMIIPIIAPGIGQLILFVAPWRWIFGALLVYAALILIWALIRLPETLAPENRTPLRLTAMLGNFGAVFSNRQMLGYTIASTFLGAGMFSYITSSEQIYVEVFDLGAAFALAFGAVAVAISIGTALNARLVMRLGMRRISQTMLLCFTAIAAINALISIIGLGSFWVFICILALGYTTVGMVMGNLNALAMEPAARMAGSAAAIYGGVTAVFGSMIGGLIARSYNGTTTPFLIGLTLIGLTAFAAIAWTERGRLFTADPSRT